MSTRAYGQADASWDIRKHATQHVMATGGTVRSWWEDGRYWVAVTYGKAEHRFAGDTAAVIDPWRRAWDMLWNFVRWLPMPTPYVWLRWDIGTPEQRAEVEAQFRLEQLGAPCSVCRMPDPDGLHRHESE